MGKVLVSGVAARIAEFTASLWGALGLVFGLLLLPFHLLWTLLRYIPYLIVFAGVGAGIGWMCSGGEAPTVIEGAGWGAALWLLALWTGCIGRDIHTEDLHQRGRPEAAAQAVNEYTLARLPGGDVWLQWGAAALAFTAAMQHFLLLGVTGSGKTTLFRLFLQTVLPPIGHIPDYRALIYDAQSDMLPVLYGIVGEKRVISLNPYDQRGYCWDIAADCTSPGRAAEIASILFPLGEEGEPYWTESAQAILTGVLRALMERAPENWTLRDVFLTMKTRESIINLVTGLDEEDILEYFGEARSAASHITSLKTRIRNLETVAALWQRAYDEGRRISLHDWLDPKTDDYVLVLGNNPESPDAINAINRAVFKRLSQIILKSDPISRPRTFIFLDELASIGYLQSLTDVIQRGRSKGVSVWMGFQSLSAVIQIYGAEIAQVITGQCNHKAFLRIEEPLTAQWASQVVGEKEALEYRVSTTSGKSSSTSVREDLVKRETLLPSQFATLPPTDAINGLTGYFLTPSAYGVHQYHIPGPELFGRLLAPKAEGPGLEETSWRPEEDTVLHAWQEADYKRLGLKRSKSAPPRSSTPKASSGGQPLRDIKGAREKQVAENLARLDTQKTETEQMETEQTEADSDES